MIRLLLLALFLTGCPEERSCKDGVCFECPLGYRQHTRTNKRVSPSHSHCEGKEHCQEYTYQDKSGVYWHKTMWCVDLTDLPL